ncbi:MAG: B12-binding domain-containing radical SAM protein [Desulfurococcales archaeon]|nr:B12-binding domain-containing radical SAM protein [Desulfurococcales archaeon]
MSGTIGLIYLSELRVALSSLAFHLLSEMIEEYGANVHKVSMEKGEIKNWNSKTFYPGKYTALFISVPYELMYKDFSYFLYRTGIPFFSKARNNEPILVLGGPAVTGNPLPIAPIADAIIIGEAEEVMEKILDVVNSDYDRSSKLKKLSEIKGILVWEANDKVERVFTKNINNSFYPIEQDIPKDIEPIWGRAFLMEVSRGCSRSCLFCMEGRIFKPVRYKYLDSISQILSKVIVDKELYRKITLYSLSFFDHPQSDSILEYLTSNGLTASIPSVRVDTLNDKRLELIKELGQKTLTLAPETGSTRLSKALRKEIYASQVEQVVESALNIGLRQFKLYLMTGFYNESQANIRDTLKMVSKIGEMIKAKGGRLKISLNPLIPKPFTPFQWHGFPDVGKLRRNIQLMRRMFGAKVSSFSFLDPRIARLQTILSRGGPELSKAIALWGQTEGFLSSWRSISQRQDLRENQYLSFWDPDYTPLWHEYIIDPFNRPTLLRDLYVAFLEFQNKLPENS